MKDKRHEISLISADLRDEEIYCQIGQSLKCLKSMISDVLGKIESNINKREGEIENIKKRALACQVKINSLTGTSKAIQIFSPAKYPGYLKYEPYTVSTYEAVPQITASQKINASFNIEKNIPENKLKLFRVNIKKASCDDISVDPNGEGLGGIPRNIEFVGSLLLFNTFENPYRKYNLSDPLSKAAKTRKIENDEKEDMQDAPATITSGEGTELRKRESYFYNPYLGEVPEIDVPLALPDLPGIADDLAYTGDVGPTIAPSGANVSLTIPDLPEITPVNQDLSPPSLSTSTFVPRPCEPGKHSQEPSTIVNVKPVPPAPPPPPPPPPPVIANCGDNSAKEQSKMCLDSESKSDLKKQFDSPTTPVADSARSDLLAAIRQAGGIKMLKSVEGPTDNRKQTVTSTEPAVGGDLMADLFNKLSMRRKGISGLNKSEVVDKFPQAKSSPLEALSAMIPPPSTTADSPDDETEDWE